MKSAIKCIASSLILFALALSLLACGREELGHAELVLPLPEGYESMENEGFDASYTDGVSVVGIIRISFDAGFNSGIPETLMPEELAEFYMKKAGKDEAILSYGDVPYYQYNEVEDGLRLYQLASFYRSKYAYFVIFFACPEDGYEPRKLEFLAAAEAAWFKA